MKPPTGRAGQLIRHYRRENGLTQAQLAKKIGISTGYMTMLERGLRTRPSEEVIGGLVKALGLIGEKAEELRSELLKDDAVEHGTQETILASPVLRVLADLMASPQGSPDSRRRLHQLIAELKELGKKGRGAGVGSDGARLLTIGYFCSLPGKGERKTPTNKRPSNRDREEALAARIWELMEIVVNEDLTLVEQTALATELLSFAQWKTKELTAGKRKSGE